MAAVNPDIEKELILRIAKGDETAFKTLFYTYYHQLSHYIFGIIKSKQIAEELVMDVFIKIWLGRDIICKIEKFDSFLFRVAHNKCIDFLRAAARDQKFKELLWNQMQLTPHAEGDSAIITHEYEARLREAISLLSPQRKKVYQLSREQEMSHDQIAMHLKLSKHTVNNHIVEAQRFIRNYFIKNCDTAFIILLIPKLILE